MLRETGMRDGHMNAVTALFNLFAAIGHIHYAKSARLCVQEMRKFVGRVSHCATEWETMGGIVDRHSDWASSDKVSEKWWWSYKRQRHDWKCAATVVVQHTSLCAMHDAIWHHYLENITRSCTYSSCGVRRGKASAWLVRHEQMYRLVWLTWSILWQCSISSGLAYREGDDIKCDQTEKVVSGIQGSFESVSVRNATIKGPSDGAHPEWLESGSRWIRQSSVQGWRQFLLLSSETSSWGKYQNQDENQKCIYSILTKNV